VIRDPEISLRENIDTTSHQTRSEKTPRYSPWGRRDPGVRFFEFQDLRKHVGLRGHTCYESMVHLSRSQRMVELSEARGRLLPRKNETWRRWVVTIVRWLDEWKGPSHDSFSRLESSCLLDAEALVNPEGLGTSPTTTRCRYHLKSNLTPSSSYRYAHTPKRIYRQMAS
jgi:hypothetical protein